jgi:hemerythrin superfamily protein
MQIDTTMLPVKGNDAVEILTNDHQVIKTLLGELVSAASTQRKSLLEQLAGVLTIHNATEENLVYPAINKLAGSKLEAQHLYHETSEADMLFFELDLMLKEKDETNFAKKAEKFADAVRHHIDEEENKAFPRLQENTEVPQREILAESVKQFRKSLHFETASA